MNPLRFSAFIALIHFSSYVLAQHPSVPMSPCSGVPVTGKLLDVRVSNCGNNFPCILKRGTPTTIEFDFVPSSDTTRIITGATGRIGGIPLPFMGTNNTPACSKITFKNTQKSAGCTLKTGEVYTYSSTFPILGIYPTTSVNVEWELVDSTTRQKLTCFNVPARII